LTKEEFAEMQKHCEFGVQILQKAGNDFKDEYKIILQHHENCDGTGYPLGLKKGEIHFISRIVHIIDVYDALTTKRSYADALNPYDALKTIKDKMSNEIDLDIFGKFVKFLGGSGNLRMN
jgi:HD-GYP domain-containing protein (c-di-GMP phosphodiesterase class II)